MQVDAIKVQVNAIKVQVDAIKVQVDAIKVQVKNLCVHRRGKGKGQRERLFSEPLSSLPLTPYPTFARSLIMVMTLAAKFLLS
ncbi:hypothetical protein [Nostoc sp. 'Lobaria pulmonaria (5183) cyanobiont']|uniref:hypothetical protein n=1 Tax=Nostoc sp. 'Lobaria pulmonaria (5183) cyanobiont' TaxID=1618022 RepID=UPI000CF31302|nr:hypothetical protein [Nostoc sp. 'Lobaria pulmonaria (5183) cyanobiont']